MKRLFLIIALLFPLGGCATMEKVGTVISAAQNFQITQGQVDSARNSYDGFV
jgi:hypothetical protein